MSHNNFSIFMEDEGDDNLDGGTGTQQKDDTLLKFIKEFQARKQYFISFVQQHTNHSVNIIFSAMNQFYDSSNKSSKTNNETHNYEEEIEKQQTNSPAACSSNARSVLIFFATLLSYLTQIIWFTFASIINSNL